jgi:lysozyme
MIISQNGLNFISDNEGGCKLAAYPDSNIPPVWTISIGVIVYPNGTPVKQGDVITQSYASQLFLNQVNQKTHGLDVLITASVNQNQFDSLGDLCFRIGLGAFASSTVRRLVNTNPSDPNITAAFEMWDEVTIDGKRVFSQGEFNRCKREATLYFT